MSTTTTNLSLVKPASNENVDLSVINGNYDKIDQFAGNVVLTADVTASGGHVTGIGQNTVSVVSATGDASDNLASLTVDGSTFTVPSTSVGTDTDGWVDDINGNDVFTPSDITITTDSTSGKMDGITINNTAYSLQKISGTENASHYLTSLTIDGTTSNVPQIEANPSGTTTGTLSSIGINGTNYNVSSGGGGASALNDLSDVVVSSPANGQALIYDNTTSKWQNSALPSGNLADLGDTTITTPTDGQVLTYDSTSSKWVNGAGGGGTTVVANPAGEATDELEKLQVGNTIYSIPSGGSGGGLTKTTLYTLTGNTPESVVTLSDTIENYDLIEIVTLYGHTDEEDYKQTAIFNSEELIDSIGTTRPKNWWIGNDTVYTWFYVTDVDEFTIHVSSGQTGLGIWYVYGYKFNGGGSGSGNFSTVSIFTANDDVQNITLSEEITDFDAISIIAGYTDGGGHQRYTATYYSDTLMANAGENVNFGVTNDTTQVHFKVIDSTHLQRTHQNTLIIEEILGVNYGSKNAPVDVTGTLTAGSTSITLYGNLESDSCINVYASDPNVEYNSITIGAGGYQLLQEMVTQESELSCTPTASASFDANPPWKAFATDSQNTGWAANANGNPTWFKVDFGETVGLKKVEYTSADTNRQQTISGIKYSDDGTTWTECTLSVNTYGNAVLYEKVNARYFQFYWTETYAFSTYPMFTTLKMYDYNSTAITVTFDEQQTDLGVKVRIS